MRSDTFYLIVQIGILALRLCLVTRCTARLGSSAPGAMVQARQKQLKSYMINDETVQYYSRRAPVYDALYENPERQSDLIQTAEALKSLVSGRKVLEIACGTGYWTQQMAKTASYVLATDINESMLALAKGKEYPEGKVSFQVADMSKMEVNEDFDVLFGGFIWSHISRKELRTWLGQLHRLVKPGAQMIFTDNIFVPKSNTPISSSDQLGNTFQVRKLPDGSEYQIMKNFLDSAELDGLFESQDIHYEFNIFGHYWMLSYTTPAFSANNLS